MTTRYSYQHCYRTLGLDADCSPEQLRLAYRRRVRACHPDRAPGSAREDEFRLVVLAYRRLAAFHRRHGAMPPPWLLVDDEPRAQRDHAGGPARRGRAAGPLPRLHALRLPRLQRAAVGTFCTAVAAAALLDAMNSPPPGDAAQDGRIAIGMDPQSVVEIQGVPKYTLGSVWFYGESGVIFERGCVVGWENQPPFPLRTLVSVAYTARDSSHGAAAGECLPRD